MSTSIDSPVAIVEQDTVEDENITTSAIFELLQPDLELFETIDRYSMSFNRNIFNGWVKQPSPCCAAAVVAGTWNALSKSHRSHMTALTHAHILEIYSNMFRDSTRTKKLSFERKLGGSIDSLLQSIELGLLATGRCVGGKKEKVVTKKTLLQVIKVILTDYQVSKPPTDPMDMNSPTTMETISTFDLMVDLLRHDNISLTEVNLIDDDSDSDSSDYDDDVESKTRITASVSIKSSTQKKKSSSSTAVWKWQKDLLAILKSKGGIIRLTAAKPSTASIGNWGIIDCIKKLSSYYELGSGGVDTNLFMGKKSSPKSKIEHILTAQDDDALISMQWDALRSAFNRDDTVLIFHLTNHYALAFAMREWMTTSGDANSNHSDPLHQHCVPMEGKLCDLCQSTPQSVPPTIPSPPSLSLSSMRMKPVRQILTARRGQRPTAWIDFEEMRAIMIGWEGYKIIKVRRKCSIEEIKQAATKIDISTVISADSIGDG